MPQPKKDPSVRARRNRASTASKLPTDSPIAKKDRPSLPASREWLPETVEWWDDLWASPMAGEFHESDRHGLFILAALIDAFWIQPDQKLAGEIRLQRQSFGLTPYDRRRLEWTIESADEAKDRGAQRRARRAQVQAKPANDPRSVLRAVN